MAQYLSNLAVGTKLKFGKYSVNGETPQDIIWLIVAKAHQSTPAYPNNSITLLAEKILDLRAFDALEPKNTTDTDRQTYGNNRYSVSNIDQWLNKDSADGEWYTAVHSFDQAPDTSARVGDYNTQYTNHPGFLNAFTNEEKDAILTTTIRVAVPTVDGLAYEDISRRIFLPSGTELGYGKENYQTEGAAWGGSVQLCGVTEQCFANTLSTSKPTSVDKNWYWWVRTPLATSSTNVRFQDVSYNLKQAPAYRGSYGVRPACNLSSTLLVSDTTDSDGCYNVAWNIAPAAPVTLNVPTSIIGGKITTISWSSAIDPDGDALSYVLECAYNGGDFTPIYSGVSTTYSHTVSSSNTSIQYRVKAIDARGKGSSYTTSAVKNIIINNSPIISGTDASLGTKNKDFSQTYSVTDGDNDAVTVVEKIDGVLIRSYAVSLGATNTFAVTGETWLALANGTHNMTVTATDEYGDSVVRTYTFTKSVTSLTIRNTAPMVASNMPTRIAVIVSRNIPAEAEFIVEVCNNGFDASPTWEDCTASVKSDLAYVFTNTTKTADSWGVSVRVTVNRNGAEGTCYISSIGGNFE